MRIAEKLVVALNRETRELVPVSHATTPKSSKRTKNSFRPQALHKERGARPYTYLEVAPPADHVDVAGFLVGPAEHRALTGHGVQRPPHALRVLAPPAHHIYHARRLVAAVKRNAKRASGEKQQPERRRSGKLVNRLGRKE